MICTPRLRHVRPLALAPACGALLLALSGCGSLSSGPATPTIAPAKTFQLVDFQPAQTIQANMPTRLAFTIQQPSGEPLTEFQRGSGPHTGVHVIVVRDDLSAIIHRHPPIAKDGRISETVTFPAPGRYRVVIDVYPKLSGPQRNFQLFRSITIPGAYHAKPVPAFDPSVTVDGYRFTMHGRPKLRAISPAFLTITVQRPNGDAARFTPWYGALAHAIFFRAGSLDYFHTHVCGAGAGGCTSTIGGSKITGRSTARGRLTVGVLVPVSGTWRLFLQCRVDGHVLTAPFTLKVA
jgi:hypothetical protein